MILSREKQIIIGTLLGDAHLAKLKTGVRLELGQSEKQKEYLFWKYSQINYPAPPPHKVEIYDDRWKKKYIQWRVKYRINTYFGELYDLFYPNEYKVIPSNIHELLDDTSLAVWFMDDGGRRNDSYGMFLNTLSYTHEDHELLMRCLKEKFSLDSRLHWVSDGYRIYIPSSQAKKFCEVVYSEIIPSMQYKLPYSPVTTSFAREEPISKLMA